MDSKIKFISDLTNNYLNQRIFEKSIQNPPSTPWLDWIESGKKTYEGRLKRGFWAKIKIGDIIIFDDQHGKKIKTKVIDLKYYKNFGEAFNELGQKLVPIQNITVQEVQKLYQKYQKQEDIKRFGVVAVGVKPI